MPESARWNERRVIEQQALSKSLREGEEKKVENRASF